MAAVSAMAVVMLQVGSISLVALTTPAASTRAMAVTMVEIATTAPMVPEQSHRPAAQAAIVLHVTVVLQTIFNIYPRSTVISVSHNHEASVTPGTDQQQCR